MDKSRGFLLQRPLPPLEVLRGLHRRFLRRPVTPPAVCISSRRIVSASLTTQQGGVP
jgi:hypothetical protein